VDEAIERLVADVLQIPATTITNDLAMKDLDVWDSLKHMELVLSIEQNFGLQLTFDEIIRMQTVGEIKRVLREREPGWTSAEKKLS
jgi:acyl carrier protein